MLYQQLRILQLQQTTTASPALTWMACVLTRPWTLTAPAAEPIEAASMTPWGNLLLLWLAKHLIEGIPYCNIIYCDYLSTW